MSNFIYTEEVTGQIVQIPVELLHNHHANPRKDYGDLSELTESIKAKGVMQNLTVVPFWFELTGVGCDYPEQQAEMGYLVVIGNRRLRAAKAAGLKELPCIISDMSHKEQAETMLIENMARSDLTPYEEALGFQNMLDLGGTVDEISERTGLSKRTIKHRVEIAKLDKDAVSKAAERQPTLMDFAKLEQVESVEKRNELLKSIGTKDFDWNIRKMLDEEKGEKDRDRWREFLTAAGLTEIEYGKVWNETLYSRRGLDGVTIQIDEPTDTTKNKPIPEGAEFFAFSTGTRALIYFRKTQSQKEADKITAEREAQIEREAEMDARIDALKAIEDRAFDRRCEWYENFVPSPEVASKVIPPLTVRALLDLSGQGYWIGVNKDLWKGENGDVQKYEDVRHGSEKLYNRTAFQVLVALLCDRGNENCRNYSWHYVANARLLTIYDIIKTLGYEPSTEEENYITGKLPYFVEE